MSDEHPNVGIEPAEKRPSIGVRVVRGVGVVLLAVAVIVASILIGLLAFAVAVVVAPLSPVMFGALIVGGVLAAVGLCPVIISRTRRRSADESWWPRDVVTQVCAAAAAVILVGVTLLAHPPLDLDDARGPEPEGTSYVDLSTGSRLAWWKTDAEGESDKAPVVFLHGGPGGVEGGTVELLDELADEGFDVYYFDQAGNGHSSILRAEEYTMERSIADLEAFREEVVKSDRINLIGHSFGGQYAEAYAAAHPGAVEKIVLATPGAEETTHVELLPEDETAEALEVAEETGDLSGIMSFSALVRIGLHGVLWSYAPDAADSYLPQEHQLRIKWGTDARVNMTANLLLSEDFAATSQWMMDRMHEDAVPTLILRSENDVIDWPGIRAYRDANRNATLVHVPERDHNILWEGSEETSPYEAIRTFLMDEPQAGTVYEGSEDPRLALGDD